MDFGFRTTSYSNWRPHYRSIRGIMTDKIKANQLLGELVAIKSGVTDPTVRSFISNFIEDVEIDIEYYEANGVLAKTDKFNTVMKQEARKISNELAKNLASIPKLDSNGKIPYQGYPLPESTSEPVAKVHTIQIFCDLESIMTLDNFKQAAARHVLIHTNGNMTKAAKILGVTSKTFKSLLKGKQYDK